MTSSINNVNVSTVWAEERKNTIKLFDDSTFYATDAFRGIIYICLLESKENCRGARRAHHFRLTLNINRSSTLYRCLSSLFFVLLIYVFVYYFSSINLQSCCTIDVKIQYVSENQKSPDSVNVSTVLTFTWLHGTLLIFSPMMLNDSFPYRFDANANISSLNDLSEWRGDWTDETNSIQCTY